ncbi:MAG TPA: flagellar basal body P-ring formation chaperone FlgA [Aquabacterium sp.]|nr:flagellar basal body P-ring formation chaperone FlgA [Aquabacterium sp.]
MKATDLLPLTSRAAQRSVAMLRAWLWACVSIIVLTLALAPTARAQGDALQATIEEFVRQRSGPTNDGAPRAVEAPPRRVVVELGQLDPRLKLAPCEKVRAYMPAGVPLWGRSRVGLRCEQGAKHWNVFWPVTVKVYGMALVAVVPLRPGALVNAADLRLAEVDLAANQSPAVVNLTDIVGRAVARDIEPGQSIRQSDVKLRRWFAAGDPVRVLVKGDGFQVSSEGTALTPGDEGRCARIRTDNGRVLCGQPVGDREVELVL